MEVMITEMVGMTIDMTKGVVDMVAMGTNRITVAVEGTTIVAMVAMAGVMGEAIKVVEVVGGVGGDIRICKDGG